MKEKLTKLSSKMNLRTYTMIVALVIICVVFQIITDGIFLSARNISNLVRSMSITGVIATGAVLLIIAGGIDLSVGSIVALAGGAAALLQVRLGLNSVAVILIAIALGTLLGMWQGFWVAYKDIPAFIATLGGMLAFRGIYIALTDGITITPMHEDFQVIASGYLPPAMGYVLVAIIFLGLFFSEVNRRKMQTKLSLEASGNVMGVIRVVAITALIAAIIVVLNSYNGTPIPVIILMIFMVVFHFISTKTKFGRDVYAIGGNVEAARLSGINVKRTMLYLYMIVGALSAVSGILLTSRLNGATSSAGNQYEMDVISACVIGGTSMSGGKGSVFGMLVGLLVISSLDNGMSLMNLPSSYQSIVKGLVLLFAVWFDVASQKKK